MEEDKIEELESLVIDLKFDLKRSKEKELIYADILSNIELSIRELLKREEENERFKLGEKVDHRECIINLKNAIDEYKRIYKISFI
jgi:hypothetical protein